MAKKVGEQDSVTGRVRVYTKTRALRKSERAGEIPLTPAPKTVAQKLKRAWVG